MSPNMSNMAVNDSSEPPTKLRLRLHPSQSSAWLQVLHLRGENLELSAGVKDEGAEEVVGNREGDADEAADDQLAGVGQLVIRTRGGVVRIIGLKGKEAIAVIGEVVDDAKAEADEGREDEADEGRDHHDVSADCEKSRAIRHPEHYCALPIRP